MKKHTIPTLLETQDRILFGLTAKQVMILFAALGCSYTLWESYPEMQLSTWGFILLLALASIPTLIGVLIAFLQLSGQPLDEWCMVWLFYTMSPHIYTRDSLPKKPQTKLNKQTDRSRREKDGL